MSDADQAMSLASTLIAALTPLVKGFIDAHPDKAAAVQTLQDIIAAAAAVPGELAAGEAENDAAADKALDDKFPKATP